MSNKWMKFPNRKKAPPRSIDSRIKQSQTHKERNSLWLYKHISWNKWIFWIFKHSKKTKNKISNSLKWTKPSEQTIEKLKKRPKRFGAKNPAWKWGVTPINERVRWSMEYKLWRKACMERDDFTCQKTGRKWWKLVVHHINNFSEYPELRTSIQNGITLLKESHKEFHKIYWTKNNTKEQLDEYLNK